MDAPRTDTTSNGAPRTVETVWTDSQPRSRVFVAGEVATSTTILQMPKPRRVARWCNEMVRQAARTLGARVEGESRVLRWIPLASLVIGLLMSAGAALMAYGVWKGRGEVKAETLTDNQKATAALIDASEARLMKAAEKLEQGAKDMRVEIGAKVDSIDGKVESIRGSVSNQQAQLAELRARLEAANEDRGRLWQSLATYELKLQRMERERLGIQPLPPPASVNPQQH